MTSGRAPRATRSPTSPRALTDETDPTEAASSAGGSDDVLQSSMGALPDVTESMRLVVAAQGGDELALDALLRRYEDRVRRIVRIRLNGKLRGYVESMDIVQETYQAALKRIDALELRGTASILQWLSTIAENKVTDAHRFFFGQKRDRDREVHMTDTPRGERSAGVELATDEKNPSDEAAHNELAQLVDESVAELPDDYREVILLRTYYGHDWEEVARLSGRPGGDAARQLHRRARIRLGRILRGKLPHDMADEGDGADDDGEG